MGKSLDAVFMSAKRCTKRGEFEEAKRLYESILLQFPNNVRAKKSLNELGPAQHTSALMKDAPPRHHIDAYLALINQGKYREAIARGRALCADYPNSILVLNGLGQAHFALGRLQEAAQSFQQATLIQPDNAEAHYNLAVILQALGQNDQAASSYEAAIAHKPDYFAAYNNLGALYCSMDRPREAIQILQGAIKLKPDYADAYNNLGNAFRAIGSMDKAIAYYEQALMLQPNHARANFNLGMIWNAQAKKGEAILYLERASACDASYADPHREMGDILLELGLRIEAIASFAHAADIDSSDTYSLCTKLHQQSQICDWDGLAEDAQKIPTLGLSGSSALPWTMLSLEDAPERHRLRSERRIQLSVRRAERHRFTPSAARPQKLRIGYFSSDINRHAVMLLIRRTIELHDRSRFEISAFSYGDKDSSEFRDLFDRFYDVHKLEDDEIVALARRNEIDIAIDLNGHTKGWRPDIFAQGLAPVQMSYLGYPGTTGADFLDYLIADPVVIPKEQRQHYSESILYLPNCYQANDNQRMIANHALSRADVGLPEQGFVFACFNSSYKITAQEFDIWVRLLSRVEGSVLWLYRDNDLAEHNLRLEATKRGIDSGRLVFAGKMDSETHLARHRLADLFLDTFNVNAHTTASDALWAGLPVLTRMGKGFAARVAGSLLHGIGLPELAVDTSEAYETMALELATDPSRLAAIKARLADNRLTKPLFDTERFVRHIEAGYDAAYNLFLSGRDPQDIFVIPA